MLDDEDDSLAANPEPPRRRKHEPHGIWVPVFRETPPTAPHETGPKVCRGCQKQTPILHSIAPDIRREFCGECQGRSHL